MRLECVVISCRIKLRFCFLPQRNIRQSAERQKVDNDDIQNRKNFIQNGKLKV